MKIGYTMDHRYHDGACFINWEKIMRHLLEDPETFNPDLYKELPSYAQVAAARKAK
jgi:hypothetical protein